jgi:peptidyl-prolyl cis-trans isomerase D
MLKVMRQSFHQLKWTLWAVVGIFIAFIFVDWGMGRTGSSTKFNSGEMARIGDQTISSVDFNHQYQVTLDRYRQMYKAKWSPSLLKALDLPNQVLNQMISRRMMLDEARRSGLKVSDAELSEKIRSFSSFRDKSGEFVGASAYASLLAANGYQVEEFEREMRDDMVLEKFNRLVAESLIIPDSVVQEQFARQNEKAKIEFVLLPPDKFGAAPQPSDAELLTYFNKNKDKFRQPERRKLKYLLVEEARLREKAKPTPPEVLAYYQAHADEFTAGERVHAAHVLIKLDQNATAIRDAAARKKAEEVLARARKGEDFAALAREFSEDPGSKDKGGDLGSFGRGQMVGPFDQAVFSMTPGEIRGPVKTSFGYHVIKLLEKIPAGPQSLAEATPRITMQLAQSNVKAMEARKVEALAKAVGGKTSDEALRKLADDGVTFNASDWVTAHDVVPGLGYSPDLLKAAFQLKKGEVSPTPIQTQSGPVLVKVADIKPPGLPDFAEVKSKVAADFKAEKMKEQSLEGSRPLASELAAGTPLEDIAKKFGVAVQSPAEFTRGAAIPSLASSEELSEAIFKTPVGKSGGPVSLGARGVVLFRVVSKVDFDPAAFAAQKEQLRETVRQQQAQKLIEADLARRRGEAKISINEESLKRFTQG